MLLLDQVTKRFVTPAGGLYTAVEGVTLDIRRGSFTAIVGPSGCGKTTLLRMIAGLTMPTAGRILVGGREVSGIQRGIGFLFQRDPLLPWRTVVENIALGLRFQGVTAREAEGIAREWAARVGLKGFEQYYPAQLSGGMRKRAALAQTLAVNPEVILMDEPFASLDVQARTLMEADLLTMCRDETKTVVFVTHDLEEAIALSDEVVVMTAGPASRVKARYPVSLDGRRDILQVRFDPRFPTLYHALWQQLRDEVVRAYGRGD
jgi:NitT/TauT family transport system ATP-binding protein